MENGRWVTINGAHVFVKDGQSPMDAFIKHEKTKKEINKKINTYSTDAYSGQVNMVKEIKNKKGETIAKLEYADYQGKAYIDFLETKEQYRGQNLATKLMDDLKKEYKENIDYGYTTADGTKFLKQYLKNKKK